MMVKFKAEPVTYDVPLDDRRTLLVKFMDNHHHDFFASFYANYKGEKLTGDTVADIVQKARDIDTEAARKRARAQVLKDAEKNPIPGVLFDKYLSPIFIRGVPKNAASDDVLITVARTGEKRRVHGYQVFRQLTDDECAALRAAQDDLLLKSGRIPDREDTRDFVDDLDLTIVVTHDPATDEMVATVDGVEFRSQYPWQLRTSIINYLQVKEFPFLLSNGSVIRAGVENRFRSDLLFRTEAEAQAYLDATQARDQARAVLDEMKDELRFDSSIFKEG